MKRRRRAAAPGLLIELCGLPGCGKTTLAAELLATGAVGAGDSATTASTPAPRRLLVKTSLALRETVRDPAAFTRLVRAVLASRQPGVRDVASVVVQRLVLRAQYRRCRAAPGDWVFEEGLVQARWTAALRASRPDALRVLEADDPAGADVVARVVAPVDDVLERLGTRASRHSRTQGLPLPQMRAELLDGDRLLDELLGC